MGLLMESELYSAPEAVQACVSRNLEIVETIADAAKEKGVRDVLTHASGSCRNAADCFAFHAAVSADVIVSSADVSALRAYGARPDLSRTLFVLVSRDGNDPEAVRGTEFAKRLGALTVSLTNDEDSPLSKSADHAMFTAAGEEKSIAATKTFTTQLAALLMLAEALGGKPAGAGKIPGALSALKPRLKNLSRISKIISNFSRLVILSRGGTEGIAREAGLKLAETARKMSFSGSCEEYVHGAGVYADRNVPVILLAPGGEFTEYFNGFARRLKKEGRRIIALTDIDETMRTADVAFPMPAADFITAAPLYAFAVQALALYAACAPGTDPDCLSGL